MVQVRIHRGLQVPFPWLLDSNCDHDYHDGGEDAEECYKNWLVKHTLKNNREHIHATER
jgi:hypothetical protein